MQVLMHHKIGSRQNIGPGHMPVNRFQTNSSKQEHKWVRTHARVQCRTAIKRSAVAKLV